MRRPLSLLRNAAAGVAIALLAACAAADAGNPPVERTDSAGVEIVRSGARDAPLAWEFERMAVIDPENSAAGVFQPAAGYVGADAAGRIFVLDHAGSRILVFGADGAFQGAYGRSGGGPGEATMPLSFSVAADGTSGMFDVGKGRIVRFGPDGAVLPEMAVAEFFGGRMALSDAALLHDFRSYDPSSGDAVVGVRRVVGDSATVLLERHNPPGKPIQLESCGMGFSGMDPIFTPAMQWDARGDRLAVAAGAEYDIRVLEDGREMRRIRRDLPPREATAALATQEIGESMQVRVEGAIRVCRTDEVVEKRGFAPVVPALGKVALSPAGELWVQRYEVGDETSPTDVFAADGAYLGTLPADAPFPAAFLPGDRIVAVEKDELDVARVVIYALRR